MAVFQQPVKRCPDPGQPLLAQGNGPICVVVNPLDPAADTTVIAPAAAPAAAPAPAGVIQIGKNPGAGQLAQQLGHTLHHRHMLLALGGLGRSLGDRLRAFRAARIADPADPRRIFSWLVACAAVASSYWRRKRPCAPAALRSSRPSTASTRVPCRSAWRAIDAWVLRRICACTAQASKVMTGMAMTSTQPSGPPITNTMPTNSTMKGRSDSADSVADAKKSRAQRRPLLNDLVVVNVATGTLTVNRMAIARLVRLTADGPLHWDAAANALPEPFHALLRHGILASENDPFDPMERAFHTLGIQHLPAPATPRTLTATDSVTTPAGRFLVEPGLRRVADREGDGLVVELPLFLDLGAAVERPAVRPRRASP